ncbi:acyltransferase [Kaistia dalseonensis]|uniref:Peptidoglycan/LPS O-acetylase OafA/YrhL n=1 Tax=Kaistia dalseonensis TaxID=410840 RepID=A0ABU0H6I6_9HYPH|nr:acyltransferase [Kaistia dalseonensis]MCX5495333.1 acyltransferase [Kaistia dalseonensis]MDQ0437919.1 peptidoglycan/LPS O-acetylase OafA/YrhL [Kaistia dalseonensis]
MDSIRGIAALSVLIAHLFMTFPSALASVNVFSLEAWYEPATYFRYTPLRAIIGGRPAVILFFVLSGFVLYLYFSPGRNPNYIQYLTRRFFRIYVPFAVSIVVAVLLCLLSFTEPVGTLSMWFNEKSWTGEPTAELVMRHLLLSGGQDDMTLNNVMWSLVHELRISLVFPLIVIIALRGLIPAVLVFGSIWIVSSAAKLFFTDDSTVHSWLDTFSYSIFFGAGTLLAIHFGTLDRAMKKLGPASILGLSLIALSLLALPAAVPGAELVYGVAASFFILLAAANRSVSQALDFPALKWLGRVSFSLYLFHLPILLILFRSFHDTIPDWLIVGLVVVFTLLAAEIGYRCIEEPSMHFGKRLTSGKRAASLPPAEAS